MIVDNTLRSAGGLGACPHEQHEKDWVWPPCTEPHVAAVISHLPSPISIPSQSAVHHLILAAQGNLGHRSLKLARLRQAESLTGTGKALLNVRKARKVREVRDVRITEDRVNVGHSRPRITVKIPDKLPLQWRNLPLHHRQTFIFAGDTQ